MTAQGKMSAPRSTVTWFAAAAIVLISAGLTALGAVSARSEQPAVSPDGIDDMPVTAAGSFSLVANFAWRAFIALNWPSRLEVDERGVPDRARSLGDPGKRAWETFKSDTELFEAGDDGRPIAPSPWASYDGRNPCGVDNRTKTIAAFASFADFNQPSFAVGEPANPLVAQNGAYTRYEIHFNEPEFSTLAASGWSQGRYFDPSKPKKLCPPLGKANTLPVDWTNPPKLDPAPMQVVRRYPIHAETMALNRAYWALPGVKGTVWEHYMLVAAQWPTSAAAPGPDNDGAFFPGRADDSKVEDESYRSMAKAQENLVNTTMETYLQDLPSSCMACHQALSNARGRDFVGILAGVR
jgi:hypothetical protein